LEGMSSVESMYNAPIHTVLPHVDSRHVDGGYGEKTMGETIDTFSSDTSSSPESGSGFTPPKVEPMQYRRRFPRKSDT
jgi:hypothetical protein